MTTWSRAGRKWAYADADANANANGDTVRGNMPSVINPALLICRSKLLRLFLIEYLTPTVY